MRAYVFCLASMVSAAWTQRADPIAVVGVQTGVNPKTGERPQRRNINDMQAFGREQWDLYIQALSEFQQVDESNVTSYFQIAGIHGYPYVSWNGVEQVPDAPNGGYCPHGEVLFATWHRPYLALFEQTLVGHALEIAKRYRPRDRLKYVAAAQTLRQPYWDWAANPNLPSAITTENITITGPQGQVAVRNPLYSYRFQKKETTGGFDGQLLNYSETVRCPVPGGTDNNVFVANEMLNVPSNNLASQTYDTFTKAPIFELMATYSTSGNSFEMPHNQVHNLAGCENGTLCDVRWSAFDPLFWLHHANVDRLIAMWQTIYYNTSTMSNDPSESLGFFSSPPGKVTANTPLKPFYSADRTFHTSMTSAQTKTFGYTYPEINDWNKSPEELRSYVINRVNFLYGQGSKNSPKQSVPKQSRARARRREATASSVVYTAEIQVDRSQLPLPCSIDVLLGNHTLGTMALLAMPMTGTAYSSIQLQNSLKKLNVKKMPEHTLVPYLQKNLKLQIRKNNDIIAADLVPRLHLELQGQDYEPRQSDCEFPKYGAARKWAVNKRI